MVKAMLVMAMSAGLMPTATRVAELPSIEVAGRGFEISSLAEGGKAFANRTYVWRGVPEELAGWRFTRLSGGLRSELTAVAETDGLIHLATASSQNGIDTTGWTKAGSAICFLRAQIARPVSVCRFVFVCTSQSASCPLSASLLTPEGMATARLPGLCPGGDIDL